MLELLRKYQSYVFTIVAFVIIISFSFFGTYNTLPADSIHEKTAFTSIDGTPVARSELEEMAMFISTDKEDKRLFGGMWGPNFLNDGVIKNDFLDTGLAEILMLEYQSNLEPDFDGRFIKEKRYPLYKHPQAQFLSVESAWAYFAPEIKKNYDRLLDSNIATDPKAINARIELFLAERKFPSPMLKQVLRYQQRQFNWVPADPNFERIDLSLFGYHTLEDWFGPRFIRLAAEFIINTSKLAEQKGYQVSKAEVIADLMRNAELSYQQNKQSPYLGVANASEYFKEQLKLLGMDKNKAVKIWRHVLLFRRLLQDVNKTAIADGLTLNQFLDYANLEASGDLYRLPQHLRFSDYRTLQKFEVYFDAVAKRNPDSPLEMLLAFNSLEQIKNQHPELVQKRYLLNVANVQKDTLLSKISLKEMWNWEVKDENWNRITNEFPEFAGKNANTREERFSVLEDLDDASKSRIDAFARKFIIQEHPEWLQEALQEAEGKKMEVGVSIRGGKSFVKGLNNSKELMLLLDEIEPSFETKQKLSQFTVDDRHYYRIEVIQRFPEEHVLTFAEANREGILDQLLDHQLEAHYKKLREIDPKQYQKEDKAWKSLAEVKDTVADFYFAKVRQSISQIYATLTGKKEKTLTGDQAASLRFITYAQNVKTLLENGGYVNDLILTSKDQLTNPFVDQWKWEKSQLQIKRSDESDIVNQEDLIAYSPGQWTEIKTPSNGDVYFFFLKNVANNENPVALFKGVDEEYHLLSNSALRTYAKHLINDYKIKGALSLDFYNTSSESNER